MSNTLSAVIKNDVSLISRLAVTKLSFQLLPHTTSLFSHISTSNLSHSPYSCGPINFASYTGCQGKWGVCKCDIKKVQCGWFTKVFQIKSWVKTLKERFLKSHCVLVVWYCCKKRGRYYVIWATIRLCRRQHSSFVTEWCMIREIILICVWTLMTDILMLLSFPV